MKARIPTRPLSWLLPCQCLLCGLPAGPRNVCGGCRRDLPWIRRPCGRCGAPLPADCPGGECAICRVPVDGVDRIRTALIYEYPVDRLVTRAKFQSRAECALALGELLGVRLRAARICGTLTPPDLIVPVPLHRRRLARRGFNQAAEIAAPIARMLGIRVMERGCRRVVDTVEQSTLSGAARRANLRGAFRVDADIGGARAAIVDDVLTTGTTVAELATALLRAGAAVVEVWTAARSHREPPEVKRSDETCNRAGCQ